jgi:hypothetical protein
MLPDPLLIDHQIFSPLVVKPVSVINEQISGVGVGGRGVFVGVGGRGVFVAVGSGVAVGAGSI